MTEVGINVACDESTVSPVRGYFLEHRVDAGNLGSTKVYELSDYIIVVCRLDVEPRRDQLGDESNDSSVADPETEGH